MPILIIIWMCTPRPFMPPNLTEINQNPVPKRRTTDAQTQGKNVEKTFDQSVSRCGGSNWMAATGRKTKYAKNMPPTQITADKTCKLIARGIMIAPV